MKFDNIEPGEQIRQIAEIIKEREEKELPTFYTISIEAGGRMTAVVEKETGAENFKTQVMNLGLKHALTAMKIELFVGRSRNAKRMNDYYIPFKKKEFKTNSLRGIDREPEITPTEEVVSWKGYMNERLDSELRLMHLQYENKNLADKIEQLKKEYEQQIQKLEKENAEYEMELERMIKEKDNSPGNVTAAGVIVKTLEGLTKSKRIMEWGRGLMGDDSFNAMQQRLAGINNEDQQQNYQPRKETAKIITDPDSNEPRQVALNFIQTVGTKLNDQRLRIVYDIMEMAARKPEILEQLRPIAENIFKTIVIRIDPTTDKKD